MTIFYVLLYYVWRQRYHVQGKNGLTALVYGLAGVRIALCMMPQNQWLSADAPLSWGIYRNIPFALLGLLAGWRLWKRLWGPRVVKDKGAR